MIVNDIEVEDMEEDVESWTPDIWEAVLPHIIRACPTKFMGRRKKRRVVRERVDLWATDWGRLLNHHNTWSPRTFEYKKRLRFRVPFPLFKFRLIPAIESAGIFNTCRQSYIPIEFKVMISLRILGRDTDCDSVLRS